MDNIRAVAFDLFNTLITVDMPSRYSSIDRLLDSLKAQGVAVHADDFMPVYRDVARQFVSEAERLGEETHNGLWVSTALQQLGIDVPPQDPRVGEAVEAYFSAFVDNARPLPGTADMLAALKPRYRLGLLSNLTHGPAARQILDHLNLSSFSTFCWFPAIWVIESRTRRFFRVWPTLWRCRRRRSFLLGTTRGPTCRAPCWRACDRCRRSMPSGNGTRLL